MSAPNVSVCMLKRLHEWGVQRVYGYPGDGTNGLNLAFHEVGDEVEFIQVRHEERSLFKDVASEYLAECNDPRQAAHLVDRAVRIARSQRTVTAIIVPSDVQEMTYEPPPRAHGALYAGEPGYHDPVIRPGDEELRRAADVLNAGARVAILVGQGAKHATDEVIEVAEVLGAGVAKALNGRAAVPMTSRS